MCTHVYTYRYRIICVYVYIGRRHRDPGPINGINLVSPHVCASNVPRTVWYYGLTVVLTSKHKQSVRGSHLQRNPPTLEAPTRGNAKIKILAPGRFAYQ